MNDPASTSTNVSADLTQRTPRRRWVRPLLYAVIFVSGGFVGTGITAMAIRAGALYVIQHPEEMPEKVAWRLRGALDLSDVQAKQVEAILRERQVAIQQIRREAQPKFEAELDRIESEIGAVLDGQQREKWQRTFRDLRHTWVPAPPAERLDHGSASDS